VSVLLDLIYTVAALFGRAIAAIRGRSESFLDHRDRRSRRYDPAARTGTAKALWLHGVSAGEVLAARRAIEIFRARHPDWEIIVTATTRLGLEAAQRGYPGLRVESFPLDFSRTVSRGLDRLRPSVIAIVEHDLWPNFLRAASDRGIPVVLINARLSPRSFRRAKLFAPVVTWPPRSLAAVLAEDEESRRRFIELGWNPSRVVATGNLKFDTPPPPGVDGLRAALGFGDDDWILVAGSTHEGEEEAALDAFVKLRETRERASTRTRLVLAPRRLERTDAVEALIRVRGFTLSRFSSGSKQGSDDVLLVDTMGDLSRLTGLGDVVFVGGTLVPVGGHNVIEPASLGRPVVIGPYWFNSRSVVEHFLRENAILVVDDGNELGDAVCRLANDPDAARQLGECARETVRRNLGASQRTVDGIDDVIDALESRREQR
jgi:3-deoxy-D-manno-octulosonic-acid transferase